MQEHQRLIPGSHEHQNLKAEIEWLTVQLESIEGKTQEFEALLVSQISDLLVEEQELSALYRRMQKAKKAMLAAQKNKGKNTILPAPAEPAGGVKHKKEPAPDDERERKRLYREALLHVHPDKFSMPEDAGDETATDITTRLIDIYKGGSLEELRDYHAYIFGGSLIKFTELPGIKIPENGNEYLRKQLNQLKLRLADAQAKHTYVVLTTYENPLDFADELKEYYTDRILKLKKRTKKAGRY